MIAHDLADWWSMDPLPMLTAGLIVLTLIGLFALHVATLCLP